MLGMLWCESRQATNTLPYNSMANLIVKPSKKLPAAQATKKEGF